MRQSVAMVMGGLLFAVIGCGSSSPEEQLAGTWTYTSGNSGVGLTFDTDGTYVAQVLQLTSATSGDDEVEKGTYVATSNQITWTPQEYTCPGPDPVYVTPYSFSGGNLVIVTPGSAAVVTLVRETSSGGGNSSLVFGCFQSGSFAAESLAPVSN
jgi:hypothetical protein